MNRDRGVPVTPGAPRLAFTTRGYRDRDNGGDPVGHIGTSHRPDNRDPRTRRANRARYRAACGVALGDHNLSTPGAVFDPDHPRACRKCWELWRQNTTN